MELDDLNARPPVITVSGPAAGGAFQLSGTGPHGAVCRILASTDLALPADAWTVLTNCVFTGGVFSFTDRQATNYGQRFYRVMRL